MKLLPKQTEMVKFNNGTYGASWFALVLNSSEGLKWIENFRKNNPHLAVKLRGRHSDRRLAYNLAGKDYYGTYREHTVPKATAERFAVYTSQKESYDGKVKIERR